MKLLKALKINSRLLLILIFFAFNVSCSDDAKDPAVPTQPGGKNPNVPKNLDVPINPDPTDTVPPAVVSDVTFGDLLNVITWTNPADFDFSKVLILKNTSSIVDAPSAGEEYMVGGALIGTSRVVHNANSFDFSDSAAMAGTLYYYKIFAYDASHNYAAGVEISTTRRSGKTIFVNAAANDANDGTSWSNAFSDLQLALKAPTGATAGDQIVVAAGVYKPAASDRTISFQLVSDVKVYGGFDVADTSLSDRNWRMNKTILSGDIDNNDVDSSGNVDTDGNSKNVVKGATDASLDGFTITAGQGISGGGLYNKFNNLELSNIIFSGNVATTGGGGMFSNGSGNNLTLSNVMFSGNTAGSGLSGGGGMYVGGDYIALSNVIFSGNTGALGGGMRINSSDHVILSNVIFSGNVSTGVGGAASIRNGSNIFLINVIMWGNTGVACTGTDFKGNEIFCTIETIANSRTINISHSLIQGCGASGGSDGFAWATGTSSCGTDGTGNIDGDRTANNYLTSNYPMFVNAGNAVGGDGVFGTVDDGLRLMTGSPAINTGSNIDPRFTDMRLLFEMGAFDLADNSRIVGSSIDMGAYESQ